MAVFSVDPLADPRWNALLLRHQRASVFHTRGWLAALQDTYGYRPIVFTTSAPGEPLGNGLLFCEVKSWITGRRFVSLPFSDHCDPLIDSPVERAEILAHVRTYSRQLRSKYVEIRPLFVEESDKTAASDLQPTAAYCVHMLSLNSPSEVLFRNLHRDCIQRKVRRAEKEDLTYEKGRSEPLLRKFYQLLLKTRRSQGLPPQPLEWFRHLSESMGDQLTIRVASKSDRPVASILTLSFRNALTYKYGASDRVLNQFGGMPFLFWKTIQEAKDQGMRQLDLGRSELENTGLIKFKDRLGASRMDLQYYRLAPATSSTRDTLSHRTQFLRRVFCHVPDSILVAAGKLMYRHIG